MISSWFFISSAGLNSSLLSSLFMALKKKISISFKNSDPKIAKIDILKAVLIPFMSLGILF